MAPIVEASSLDLSKMYAMSRYGKGEGEDYWNCPLTREEYERFLDALLSGETVPIKDFEKGVYFEGCLPIEVMAERGRETLRHGPMKPMGLPDPKTGRLPWAVVQLRQDDLAREHYNIVGFQTKLKIPEQQRVFRMIPGLENAVFARYGMLHRNTYIHAPAHLDRFFRMRREPRIFFAGQITGVEGYVESAATGLAVGLALAQILEGREPVPVPYTTAIGSLARHCSERPPEEKFEPMNVTFGLIEDTSHSPVRDKQVRRQRMVDRALAAIAEWKGQISATPRRRIVGSPEEPNAHLGGHPSGEKAPRGRRPPHARPALAAVRRGVRGPRLLQGREPPARGRLQVPGRVQQDEGRERAREGRGRRRVLLREPRAGRGARGEASRTSRPRS